MMWVDCRQDWKAAVACHVNQRNPSVDRSTSVLQFSRTRLWTRLWVRRKHAGVVLSTQPTCVRTDLLIRYLGCHRPHIPAASIERRGSIFLLIRRVMAHICDLQTATKDCLPHQSSGRNGQMLFQVAFILHLLRGVILANNAWLDCEN